MKTYKYFNVSEFDCQHTGDNMMSPGFIMKLDRLREVCGFPFVITSGYRSPKHPIEAAKSSPGTHTMGIAADIAIRGGWQRFKLVDEALAAGFTGIGVGEDFIHLDTRQFPMMWIYGS